ncbi:DUF3575 domain-containing protein [Nonlabens ponticola]|uniref:DUF3575 domain-containing protein n=1 Tax=Nonlabens ponticola TaxID=2496866 RepID=A0A3S9MWX8_9FLAO|nr:DUF3575 domain-containing protein [Nonlabens ponticola]AZQ43746.1 DUF3575 domain-containing protein [Nonlabens ponticola]
MKKLLFVAAILAAGTAFAQDTDQTDSERRLEEFNNQKRHEVSLDVVAGIAGLGINPRYEYVLGRYSGVGADLNIGIADEDDLDYRETFSLTPYYRQYFFSKEDYGAKGFYAEGFLKFYTFEDDYYNFDSNQGFSTTTSESYFETAIGAGIGWKWVSNSGFLIDINLGIGRNLGLADEPEDDYLPEVTGRGGVNFGWRF